QKDAAAAAQLILDENNAAVEKAAQSGNPGELLMMSAPDEEFTRLSELLMKQTFMQDYDGAAKGSRPKVLMKFGDWHLYKGFNPLQNNDIGNFMTELADGQGTKALHIIILPVKGTRLRFAGIGRPYSPESFKMLDDNDYKFMQPFVDGAGSEGWTVFDLRKLRGEAIS